MGARVTDAEVKQVLSTEIDTTPFINAAHRIVEDNELGTKGVGSSTLKSIEQFLAAHLASSREKQVKSETTGRASVTYQGETGTRFDGTQYGQTAISLDWTGTLAALSNRKVRAQFMPV